MVAEAWSNPGHGSSFSNGGPRIVCLERVDDFHAAAIVDLT